MTYQPHTQDQTNLYLFQKILSLLEPDREYLIMREGNRIMLIFMILFGLS